MNPHQKQSISLQSIIKSIKSNRTIIYQMANREIFSKYKGSFLGIMWSFLTPVLMLFVYTFVFSVVFKARWPVGQGGMDETKTNFAIFLFIGLLIHGLFAEVIGSSTTIIESNINLVKKVVFPLEVLVYVKMLVAIFNFCIGLLVLLLALVLLNNSIHLTILFIPIVIFPLILLTVGVGWLISSLSVYVKDIVQPVNILITIMLFLSPVFFPLTSVPESYRGLIGLNPLTFVIEQARVVLVIGETPNFLKLFNYTCVSGLIFWLGYAWFQKTRKGFADVV